MLSEMRDKGFIARRQTREGVNLADSQAARLSICDHLSGPSFEEL